MKWFSSHAQDADDGGASQDLARGVSHIASIERRIFDIPLHITLLS